MKKWTIQELNDLAFRIQTDPHVLIDEMTLEEFRAWIAGSSERVLVNLLHLLEHFEMYEHCRIVREEIEKL